MPIRTKCRRPLVRAFEIALVVATSAAGMNPSHAAELSTRRVSFARDVKPILSRHCIACHGPAVAEAGLRLDQRETALGELDSGAHAIVPGNVGASALVDRISDEDASFRMPPEGAPLTSQEIELVRQWIADGAAWEKHWAFEKPRRRAPPEVKDSAWTTNPIDDFILAQLEESGLTPAPPADRRTLARRAYYGITGLPPTREQLQAFEQDTSADAWERLVDDLLERPQYGEHWARHWLDLVRFAETNSFERDGPKPNAWKYRDYVIRAFNDDKPYDQFVREQLAGDELDEVTEDSITATAYYRLGIWDDEPADAEQARYDEWDDIVSTTSQVMLGLTVGCARCHDHKIDPIPQTDYYGLLAFFADVTPYGQRNDQETNSQWDFAPPPEAARRRDLRGRRSEIETKKKELEQVGIRRLTAAEQRRSETSDRQRLLDDSLQLALDAKEWLEYVGLLAQLKQVDDEIAALPPANLTLALATCDAHPAPTRVMVRGNPHVPGEVVDPHFPRLFGDAPPEIAEPSAAARSAGRRRVLAEWIASPENMLSARVIVNRVWQHHFGRGIVRSSNNFGELGTPPTHPELLDWLALWLIDHDWKLKPLHRLVMTSSAYRMSSRGNERGLAVDPLNDLFWRIDARRLTAEEVRDSMLVVTGELNLKMFGPSLYPSMPAEVLATQSMPGDGWGDSPPEEQSRRSIYVYVKRSLLSPLLTAFDFPDTDVSCEARFNTLQPGQALALLNSEFAQQRAAVLARRVGDEAGSDVPRQVAAAVELVLNRPAADDEIAEGVSLVHRMIDQHQLTPAEALERWCLVTLNLNEFLFLD